MTGRAPTTLAATLLLLASGSALNAQTEVDGPPHTTLVRPPFAHTMGIHHARPMHLKLFLGDRTKFDDPQGVAAVKFASDDDPGARRDDFQLTLFGVNSGRGEILYNSSMQTLAIYGRTGSGEAEFLAPRGIAATVDGRVYVADTGNGRVVRLRWNPIGRSLEWVGTWAAGRPTDVATDARGQLYTVDYEAGAVLRFADSIAGAGTNFLAPSPIGGDRWPLPDDVEAPISLAVGDSLDPWYSPAHYRLLLVDRDGQRLRAIDDSGRVVAESALPQLEGEAHGAFAFVELDYYGNVYATDRFLDVVYKFDPDLRLLTKFPGSEPGADGLDEPRGVAIWRRFGQVFVAERDGAHYYFIGTDFEPRTGPLEVREMGLDAWALELFMTEAAMVSLSLVDAAGDTLASADLGTLGVGEQLAAWDATGWKGPPAEGWRERVAHAYVEARPTYSSRKRFSRVRRYEIAWRTP